MKIISLIIIFLLLGAFFIISEKNLALRRDDSRGEFKNLYLTWAGHIFQNAKELVGNIVNLDWLPDDSNSTDS